MKNHILIFMAILCGCSTQQPVSVPAPTNSVTSTIRSVVAPPFPPMPVVGVVSHDTAIIPIIILPPSNTVVALVWSNIADTSPTNFHYWYAQQSTDFVNWTNCNAPYWFDEVHQTVELVTNTTALMFFRLVGSNALPIIPPYNQYPIGVINNGQGIDAIQQTFNSELASTRNILVLK